MKEIDMKDFNNTAKKVVTAVSRTFQRAWDQGPFTALFNFCAGEKYEPKKKQPKNAPKN
jgi:hypothetical protein